ncbi:MULTISPECIES: hypothetical protein [unclassified Treponema]|uniref:hypothetical protein n=1 Tax=unclassified Treponema TaxID=2638727 RepID=UPI0020A2BB18|nr:MULTISPECIES: hypothetical protein [unclassified Treponema]UTC67964.1 hypothetical protein E4O06_04780 [Treponema sp. OMZ 789]UTC70678.1 hypothetical protein E4O01_04765 [Treponema sp. OMZ 790]UTC73408.1 hypothetical protein E4O02_05015 [Treponema sp. OMZ 791]
MFLKEKIGLSKKSAFLCLLLVVGSFAAALNAAEKAEFVISDEPFIYKDLPLIPWKKYTRDEIEKKLGKPDWHEDNPGGWCRSYEDKIVFNFDQENSFDGFVFKYPEKIKGLNIYGLFISKDDNHSSIVKKLIELKRNFNVIYKANHRDLEFKVRFKNKFGNVLLVIYCSTSNKQEVTYVSLWYVD